MVISSLAGGGAERVMSIMANYWAARGQDITFITLSSGEDDFYALHPQVRRLALGLLKASENLGDALWNGIRRVSHLRKALRASCPDFVISFMDTTNIITLLACCGLGLPVVISERTDPRQHNIGRTYALMRRVLYRWAHAVVVQTEGVREWVESFVPREAVFRIPNPVEPPSYPSESPSQPLPAGRLLVSMGRLGWEKGYDLLLQAFARCAGKHQDWSLVILGEGNQRNALEELSKQLGISDRVYLPGRVQHPETVLRCADLFALSSRREGFPNGLLEAMACRLPVVSFDCRSGPGEIIRHGIDGLLVTPNDVGSLAVALDRLMSDEGERKRLASRADEVLERFSVSKVMAMWEDILRERACWAA